VRPVKVRYTTYYAHELATQLKGAGKVKLVVSWKELAELMRELVR
jgi:hypothetical protein